MHAPSIVTPSSHIVIPLVTHSHTLVTHSHIPHHTQSHPCHTQSHPRYTQSHPRHIVTHVCINLRQVCPYDVCIISKPIQLHLSFFSATNIDFLKTDCISHIVRYDTFYHYAFIIIFMQPICNFIFGHKRNFLM